MGPRNLRKVTRRIATILSQRGSPLAKIVEEVQNPILLVDDHGIPAKDDAPNALRDSWQLDLQFTWKRLHALLKPGGKLAIALQVLFEPGGQFAAALGQAGG